MTTQYEFGSLEKRSTKAPLPVEGIVFNGISLDEELPLYQTLNVEGRENFSRTVNSVSTSADGELFISSKLDANTITINYAIDAHGDLDAFNQTFTRLKMFLQGEEVEFYFRDEPEFTRTGTVTKFENPNPGRTSLFGSFEIQMSDPYRHGQLKTITGTNELVLNDPQLFYKQRPERIEIIVNEDNPDFVLNVDNSYNMTLHGAYTANSNIVVDFASNSITSNGRNILPDMDILDTNIFELLIKSGQRITTNNAKSIQLKYKVAML